MAKMVFEIYIAEPFDNIVKNLCKGSSEPGFQPVHYVTRALIKTIAFDAQKPEWEVEAMVKSFVSVRQK